MHILCHSLMVHMEEASSNYDSGIVAAAGGARSFAHAREEWQRHRVIVRRPGEECKMEHRQAIATVTAVAAAPDARQAWLTADSHAQAPSCAVLVASRPRPSRLAPFVVSVSRLERRDVASRDGVDIS